ncbi:hypothetical protein IE81DRAFT_301592 [Ceraceosorus guamensis]|uniref:Ribosomal protein S8 n=1 Tax=Ceraceosorus guamensis TaxID=1522189 RepID=A0A316W1X6_9BASI|nr:hypothetical protein IE81DRAFT_301592 [Ceraceosorus guamensis]PWN42773.1 hypothetical protein IE81DRAFT_301592 [Ceraceosorus guamensis]
MLAHDLCAMIQNGARGRIRSVPLPFTKRALNLSSVLLKHGFLYNVTLGTHEGPSPSSWHQATSDGSRKIWLDIKYTSDQSPVLRQLNVVSKPSKRIFVDEKDLLLLCTGRRAAFVPPFRTGEIGIVDAGEHGWCEAREAIERKWQGELVARAM